MNKAKKTIYPKAGKRAMLMFLKTLNIIVKLWVWAGFQKMTVKLTMPEIFSYPASPHLATKIDGREIDFTKIERALQQLAEKYGWCC